VTTIERHDALDVRLIHSVDPTPPGGSRDGLVHIRPRSDGHVHDPVALAPRGAAVDLLELADAGLVAQVGTVVDDDAAVLQRCTRLPKGMSRANTP
jgi:hypothetical protein